MSNVDRQAHKDAEEYAKAYMSYGEGAGTRRKLINGTVEFKKQTVPGYAEAFERNARHQNMAEHAKRAQQEARRKNVTSTVTRNARAIATGRHENLTTGFLITSAVVVGLHQTGLDRDIYDFSKRKLRKIKARIKARFAKKDATVIHNITNL